MFAILPETPTKTLPESMIATMRQSFEYVDRLDESSKPAVDFMFSVCSEEALRQLAQADIRHVSFLARERLGLNPKVEYVCCDCGKDGDNRRGGDFYCDGCANHYDAMEKLEQQYAE